MWNWGERLEEGGLEGGREWEPDVMKVYHIRPWKFRILFKHSALQVRGTLPAGALGTLVSMKLSSAEPILLRFCFLHRLHHVTMLRKTKT